MPDWSKADPEVVREALHSGERYLQGQLAIATSADQRGAVLAGIFTAAGTAIFAGLIALSTSSTAAPVAIIVGGFVSGALFLVAATLCILAVLPVGFSLSGNQPKSWYEDIDSGKKPILVFGDEAENYQRKIKDNRKVLKKNARLYKFGALLGTAAPTLGLLLWALFHACAALR